MARAVLLLACLTAVLAQPVFVPVSVAELVGMSDVIVDAKVDTINAARVGLSRNLETPVDFAVAQVLKGPADLKNVIVVEPGGKMGTRQEVHYNQIIPEAGGRYVLFLKRSADGTFTALGGLHGHYRVVDGRIQMHPAMPRILKAGFADAPVEKLVDAVRSELAHPTFHQIGR